MVAEEIIPGVHVPHARPAPQPPALEPFLFRLLPAGCLCIPSSMPADVGCFHWLLGLWVFVFPREVRWKEEDNRMLGFFFLTAAEETASPLARRAPHGWEQSYSAGG